MAMMPILKRRFAFGTKGLDQFSDHWAGAVRGALPTVASVKVV